MFLGENLPSWLILAIGAALAVGNLLALVNPKPPAQTGDAALAESLGVDAAPDAELERPPLLRSLLMITLGSVAAIWALASLIG